MIGAVQYGPVQYLSIHRTGAFKFVLMDASKKESSLVI